MGSVARLPGDVCLHVITGPSRLGNSPFWTLQNYITPGIRNFQVALDCPGYPLPRTLCGRSAYLQLEKVA